jgi:hypothetical protein
LHLPWSKAAQEVARSFPITQKFYSILISYYTLFVKQITKVSSDSREEKFESISQVEEEQTTTLLTLGDYNRDKYMLTREPHSPDPIVYTD